jgi:hypothetical protein
MPALFAVAFFLGEPLLHHFYVDQALFVRDGRVA